MERRTRGKKQGSTTNTIPVSCRQNNGKNTDTTPAPTTLTRLPRATLPSCFPPFVSPLFAAAYVSHQTSQRGPPTKGRHTTPPPPSPALQSVLPGERDGGEGGAREGKGVCGGGGWGGGVLALRPCPPCAGVAQRSGLDVSRAAGVVSARASQPCRSGSTWATRSFGLQHAGS